MRSALAPSVHAVAARPLEHPERAPIIGAHPPLGESPRPVRPPDEIVELIRGLHNLQARHRGCVATIGNFDGVHLGHRAILAQLLEQAELRGLPGALVCFEPQPQEFFAGANAPPRLTRLREKLELLRQTRLARVLVLRFDAALAARSAQAFIDEVLVAGLGVRDLVVGDDFRFGHNGEGNFDLLVEQGVQQGFEVHKRATFAAAGGRVSSSWVRDALANGELALAAELLGRRYAISGRVVHGRQLGRSIGFATANVALGRMETPLRGVYAVRVDGAGEGLKPGVANLGRRPTVDGERLLLEVHLFDFDGDVYGCRLRVEFAQRIRDERRFASLDELKAQIARDATAARVLLGA